MEGVVGVQNNAQFAFVRTSDVPSIQQGDTLVISGATYTVVEVMPDGEGMIEDSEGKEEDCSACDGKGVVWQPVLSKIAIHMRTGTGTDFTE